VLGGAVTIVLVYVIALATQDWGLSLNHWLIILGSIAAGAVVVGGVGRTIAGFPGRTVVRIAAALVGGYAVIEVGDLLASLGHWSVIDIALTILEVAAAGALAYGAWALSDGDLIADITGAKGAAGLPVIDRFVYVGSAGIIAALFLVALLTDFAFVTQAQLAVLASILVLAVRWLAATPAAGSLPVRAVEAIAGLGALAVIVGLWLLAIVVGHVLEGGTILDYALVLLYAAATASLGAGAFLGPGSLNRPNTRA